MNFLDNITFFAQNHIQGTEMEVPGIYITGHPPTPPDKVFTVAYIALGVFFILSGVLQHFLKKWLLTPKKNDAGEEVPVKGKAFKTVLIILFIVLFFFAGVETTLQIYVYNNPYQTFIPDPTAHWKINPAIQRKYDKNQPTHRMDGLLDFEYNRYKEDGAYRILCYGDSQTMGTPWVPDIQLTYSKILQKKLREEFPDKNIQVINMGISGYSSVQGLMFFKNVGLLYNPDCIVVGLGYHDAGLSMAEDKEITSDKPWLKKLRMVLYRSQIYLLIRKKVLEKKRVRGEYKFKPVRRVSKEDYRANLKTFVDIGKEKKIKVIFLTVPQGGAEGVFHPEYTEVMRKAGKDFDIMIADGAKAMKEVPDDQKLSYFTSDKVHFNKKGNEFVGQVLYETVRKIFDKEKPQK